MFSDFQKIRHIKDNIVHLKRNIAIFEGQMCYGLLFYIVANYTPPPKREVFLSC